MDSEHDNLVTTTLDLHEKFHAGEPEVTGDMAAFLVSWLTNHIPNINKLYGPFLNEKGVACNGSERVPDANTVSAANSGIDQAEPSAFE